MSFGLPESSEQNEFPVVETLIKNKTPCFMFLNKPLSYWL